MSDIDENVASHRRSEAERWLGLAGEDARVARLCLAAAPPALASAAFHTQQAAEKVLKGFLVLAEIRFGKTHDLDRLTALAGPAYPYLGPLFEAVRPRGVRRVHRGLRDRGGVQHADRGLLSGRGAV